MVKKIISLDCDGVIVDTGNYLKETFYDFFKKEVNKDLIKALISGKETLKMYTEYNNLDYEDLNSFFENYEEKLFRELSSLNVMEGAVETIDELQSKNIEVIVNSYRPQEHNGLKQDTKRITKEWFESKKISIPINLAQTKEEKCKSILRSELVCHVDDDYDILKKIENKDSITPILFRNWYHVSGEDFISFNSWKSLSKFLLEL